MTVVEPEEGARHILVVANETVTGHLLTEALERRAEEGPIRVTVIAPINHPREGYVVYEDTRRAAAGRRLDRTLAKLREEGIPAHGLVVDTDPAERAPRRDRAARAGRDHRLDAPGAEVGLAAAEPGRPDASAVGRPAVRAHRRRPGRGGRRRAERPRRRERDAARRPAARAHPRAGGAEPGELPDRQPAERPDAGQHPEAERRLRRALAELRSDRHRRPWPDRAPGSLRGRDAGRPRRAGGRDHRLDLPAAALGLAPARPRRAPEERQRRAGRPHRRRPERCGGAGLWPPSRQRFTRITRPSRTRARASMPACSGCSCSSRRRSCSSGCSSPSTSSTGSWTRRRAVAAAAVPPAGAGRRDEHGDPRHLELHDPLGAPVDQARQPRRDEGRARAHLPARPHVPAHADPRVLAARLRPARRRLRLDLLRRSRGCTGHTSSSGSRSCCS